MRRLETTDESAAEDTDSTAETSDEAMSETADESAGETGEALTVDGFDFDRVVEMIDGSESIGSGEKMLLKTGLESARDNPEMLEDILNEIKQALDM